MTAHQHLKLDILAFIGYASSDLHEGTWGIERVLAVLAPEHANLIPAGWADRWTSLCDQQETLVAELRASVSAAAGPPPEKPNPRPAMTYTYSGGGGGGGGGYLGRGGGGYTVHHFEKRQR